MPSIEKRGNNSWRLVVEDGYDSSGKRIQRRKTIKVDDEELLKPTKGARARLDDYLRLELARFREEVESGSYVKVERMSFAEFVPVWKTNYADSHMGAYTRKNCMAIIKARLIPAFGHLEMNKIKPMHVVFFMTELRSPDSRRDGRDKPLATNTLSNVFKTLKSIFDAAAKWQIITNNPMDGVDRPTADKAERRDLKTRKHAYTLQESAALIEALNDEPEHWRLYFLGVLLGGFRRGEMLAVEWSHVDFPAGGLHIEKQISLTEDGKRTEAELKTEESAAFVPMPRWYMAELEQYKKRWNKTRLSLGDKWKGGRKQYAFHTGFGEPFFPTVPTYRWRQFLKRHDLPHVRLHDLRHTTATLLREDGADLKAIQERLRHTRLSTTADLYTHASELVNRETADRLEKLDPGHLKHSV